MKKLLLLVILVSTCIDDVQAGSIRNLVQTCEASVKQSLWAEEQAARNRARVIKDDTVYQVYINLWAITTMDLSLIINAKCNPDKRKRSTAKTRYQEYINHKIGKALRAGLNLPIREHNILKDRVGL